jgi:hypothetical protein
MDDDAGSTSLSLLQPGKAVEVKYHGSKISCLQRKIITSTSGEDKPDVQAVGVLPSQQKPTSRFQEGVRQNDPKGAQ